MIDDDAQVQAAVWGMLDAVTDDLGRSLPAEWGRVLSTTPRHRFLPDTIWLADRDPYRPVSRPDDQAAWFRAAYADAPVITQINDGAPPFDADDVWASSSASQPSIVVRMLMELDAHPGQRVMEIGTGTGWNTALLAERVGAQNVVSIELDVALAARARDTLRAAGVGAMVVVGDGADG
ncbi:MAG TPA: rRNA adenine N-6-methyltransferase family protein [Jiangellaceae bacterium]